MKKVILLALTALIMIGCAFKNNQDVSRHVIILDSCEYIQYFSDVYYTSIEHKGNCRFCEERDSIKWEKRKKELLKELVIKIKEK